MQDSQQIIVKPAISCDAIGTLVLDKEKFDILSQHIKNSGIKDPENQIWIAQTRVSGFLFSLEGFCLDRQVTFLGFSRRARMALTEVANYFPANNDLLNSVKLRCKNAIITLFKKLDFKNGYFHSEFIIRDDKCYLIDANVGRIAVGALSEQIARSFNVNPVKIFGHVINVGVFGGKSFDYTFYSALPVPTLCIHYGLNFNEHFLRLKLPDDRRCIHTQFLKENSPGVPLGKNDHSYIGSIVRKRK